jgi:hypothetical protein
MTRLSDDELQTLQRLAQDINAGGRLGRILVALVKFALAGSTMALAALHVWQWLHPHVTGVWHAGGGD